MSGRNSRLPPEVNRILFVRNLPYKISGDDLYEIFGKYGAIRQIRVGTNAKARGTAFVVYEDIFDAYTAQQSLTGFKVGERYLACLFYRPTKESVQQAKDREVVEKLKRNHKVAL